MQTVCTISILFSYFLCPAAEEQHLIVYTLCRKFKQNLIIYFLNLYFPFPYPDTGSIISACTKFERSFDTLEFFKSSKSVTALLHGYIRMRFDILHRIVFEVAGISSDSFRHFEILLCTHYTTSGSFQKLCPLFSLAPALHKSLHQMM